MGWVGGYGGDGGEEETFVHGPRRQFETGSWAMGLIACPAWRWGVVCLCR